MIAALAIPLALALDVAVGEPPRRLHPVAWFGELVAPLDREWPHPGAMGLAVALVAPLLAAGVVGAVVGVVAQASVVVGGSLAGIALFSSTSLRRLLDRSRSVIDASETDLAAARTELRALVGREPGALSPGQVRSAAVESAAENLADGLVAPLLAFAVGGVVGAAVSTQVSLAFAAGAAAWVKAVNTIDSTVGYPDKPHGRVGARLDDVVMWVPARVTAGLLALIAGRPSVLREVRPWLDGVASPNSGWPMGTIGAIADCRLEKTGAYALNPDAALPDVAVARGAVRTVAYAGGAAYVLATLLTLMGVIAWS